MKYSNPDNAYGECARSGKKTRLSDLVKDGYQKGIYVRREWYDPPQPQEKLKPLFDAQMTRIQAPRTDIYETTVTFPAYDINTGNAYGGMQQNYTLGNFTSSVTTGGVGHWLTDVSGERIISSSGDAIVFKSTGEVLWVTGDGVSWIVTDSGESIVFNG